MFVRLTKNSDGSLIVVNFNLVLYFVPSLTQTYIQLTDNEYVVVQQSVAYIEEKLKGK